MKTWQNTKQIVKSLATRKGPFGDVDEVRNWMVRCNHAVQVRVDLVPFNELQGWKIDEATGNIVHQSGKFFSICGLHMETEGAPYRSTWDQPIIDQPEVGFLGIIAKEIDGVLCFLLQAKIEPGNINNVQLSPTLQATRSNYMQVHKGKVPLYLEYFRNFRNHQVLVDQLQSEQGGRFLRKRNRNIIIEVAEDIPIRDNFVWLTLGQIKELMRYDNIINMDSRTVLSGLLPVNHCSFDEYCYMREALSLKGIGYDIFESRMVLSGVNTIDDILSWFSDLKSNCSLFARPIPLREVSEWNITDDEVVRKDRKFFRVIGANITIENREVAQWAQPLIQPMQEGICGLILKRIGSVIHLLVQAKLECGNLDILEFAPSVQCLTGDYRERDRTYVPPYLEYILHASPEQRLWDVKQSEEGGRFFREQNRNVIVLAGDDFDVNVHPYYCWMTLGQIYKFLQHNNYLNIQLRSLLALIDETYISR